MMLRNGTSKKLQPSVTTRIPPYISSIPGDPLDSGEHFISVIPALKITNPAGINTTLRMNKPARVTRLVIKSRNSTIFRDRRLLVRDGSFLSTMLYHTPTHHHYLKNVHNTISKSSPSDTMPRLRSTSKPPPTLTVKKSTIRRFQRPKYVSKPRLWKPTWPPL